ncbi:MAG TPA: LamG-like jellyroll fold domain-containing protein, partial [Pyrinomonadaceae bacterium]
MKYLFRHPLSSYKRVVAACLLSYVLVIGPIATVGARLATTTVGTVSGTARHSGPGTTATPDNNHVSHLLPAPVPAPLLPAITATKTGVIIGDDGDGKADPGATEKIEYTVTISNNGTTDATGVTLSDTIDVHTTLVGGSVNTQPIADPDTYSASGNIPISLAAPGVLANDRDPDTGNNSGLTVTKVQGLGASVGLATDTTATGRNGVKGSVTLNSNGSFTYEPPPGLTGTPAVDSFTYETSDGSKTDTATVTINITNIVWFISNNAGGLNRGTFTHPFTSIASFNTANAATGAVPDPKNGDFIALRTGSGTYTETDGVNLRLQQRLIGNAVQFNTVFTAAADSGSTYNAFAGATAAAPNIITTGGNGVDLSTDNTVRGLNIGNTPGFFKINGGALGSPIINTVNLTGTGGALNISTSAAFGSNVSFGTFESTSSPAANLNLVGVTGTLGVTSAGAGLSGSAVASAAVNVNGGTVSFTYSGNVSKTNAGSLVSISGGHNTGIITFQTGTLSATSGDGLQFNNADGTYNFNGTSTLNGGDAGIDILNGSGGSFTFSAASTITSPTGTAFNVGTAPGSPNVTYNGSVTQNTTAQRAVNVDGTSGGAIAIATVTAGSTAGGVGNTGVNISNATGSVTFTNLNLGTSGTRMNAQAVTIAGGSGAKNLGAVSIFTTGAAEGIHSTTTTGAISITTGTVNSAGAAAINIAGTSAGSRTPLNIQLTSLSANGGTKGLILLNTSATGSPGGFRVNGTGTTDGSGGTIQNTTTRGADIQTVDSLVLKNMNFTNANSSVDGGSAGACDDLTFTACNSAIYLNGLTTLATFDNLNLTGTMVENGVTAIGVANFKFDNSLIDGAGNDVHESGIEAQNLSGTATVNNTEIRFSETDAFAVTNTDTSVNLMISSSTFRDSQTQFSGGPVNTNGEGGFQFRSFSVAAGQPTATINILNSSFLRLRTQSLQVFSNDDTTINLDLTGSTIDSQADIGTGIDINADDTSTFNFNILNNPTIQSRGGAAVNITSFINGHIEGRVNSNPNIRVLGGAGIPVRLVAQESSTMVVEIDGNTVSNVNGTEDTAIDVQSRFQDARVDATITDNTVTGTIDGVAGINLISGSSTAGESNITCGDVSGNNVTNAAGNVTRAFRIRVSDLSNTNRMFLEGFVEAGTALQDTEATWNGRSNTPVSAGGNEVAASLTGTAVGPLAPPGGACQAVDIASDFAGLRNFDTPGRFVNKPFAESEAGMKQAPPVESALAKSTQQSPIGRAINALAYVTSGIVSLIQPTAIASNDRALKDSGAEAFGSRHQPLQVRTDDSVSVVVAQKAEVTSPDKNARKRVLSHHARGTRSVPAMLSGETVTVNIGTLRAGDSVTITFEVTVNNPPNLTLLNPARVSNQGLVEGTNFTDVQTDDASIVGAADPTETLVDLFDSQTAVGSSDPNIIEGESVTFTATVTPVSSGPTPVTGTVDFFDGALPGGTLIAGCDNQLLSGNPAQATCATTALTAAGSPHTITARYNADGGNYDASSGTVSQTVILVPDLTIDKQHTGTFFQGQTGGTYTITVTNSGNGPMPTGQTISVTDTLPDGLTATAMTGTGWTCQPTAPPNTFPVSGSITLSCARTGETLLAAGASYPNISLTVTVDSDAPTGNPALSNDVSVTQGAGGEVNTGNNSDTDPTAINAGVDLTINKSHTDIFTQGDIGKTYTITVTNNGGTATSGTVTVTDTLPTGLTPTAPIGAHNGWTCTIVGQDLSCTRSDALNPTASYPTITLTVDVANNAPTSVDNTATVSGGGDINATNNSDTDQTTINQLCMTPPANMVAWWTADDTARDIAGGNDGTLNGNAGYAAGKVLNGFNLDGTGDYVDVGDVDLPATFTIDAWVNATDLTSQRTIVSKDDGAASSYHFFITPAGALQLVVTSSAGTTIYNTSAGAVTAAAFKHVAVSYDGAAAANSKILFYVDGALVASTATTDDGGTPNNTSLAARIGDDGSGTSPFLGVIDEVEFFSIVLAGTDILALFNAGAGGKCKPSDLKITKTHSGNFYLNQTGATYTITVTNDGPGATSGTVTVIDTLPAGLTATGFTGTNWTCQPLPVLSCSRNDALASGGVY